MHWKNKKKKMASSTRTRERTSPSESNCSHRRVPCDAVRSGPLQSSSRRPIGTHGTERYTTTLLLLVVVEYMFVQSVHSSKRPCNALHAIERQAARQASLLRPSSRPTATVKKSRWISMHRETERERERGNIYVYYFKYAELFFVRR